MTATGTSPTPKATLPSKLVLRQSSSTNLAIQVSPPGPAWRIHVDVPAGVSANDVSTDDKGRAELRFVTSADAQPDTGPTTVTFRHPEGTTSSTVSLTLDVRGKAGSIDTRFGSAGTVDSESPVTVFPDGSFLTPGRDATGPFVRKRSSDASSDATFGTGGLSRYEDPAGTPIFLSRALARDADFISSLTVATNDRAFVFQKSRDGRSTSMPLVLPGSYSFTTIRPLSAESVALVGYDANGWAAIGVDTKQWSLLSWGTGGTVRGDAHLPAYDLLIDGGETHVFVKDSTDKGIGAIAPGLLDVTLTSSGSVKSTRPVPTVDLFAYCGGKVLGSDDFLLGISRDGGSGALVSWKSGISSTIAKIATKTQFYFDVVDDVIVVSSMRPEPDVVTLSPGPSVTLLHLDGSPVREVSETGTLDYLPRAWSPRRVGPIVVSPDKRTALMTVIFDQGTTMSRIWL